MTRALDFFDLARDYNDDPVAAFRHAQCSYFLASFSTDWRFSPQRSREIAKSHGDALVIVTGDFNTDEGSAPYQSLVTDADDSLADTYRATHAEVSEVEGTFNGFKGIDDRARIDWVLVDPRWKVQSAAIVRRNEDGRYPSDHFPVTAVLRFPH